MELRYWILFGNLSAFSFFTAGNQVYKIEDEQLQNCSCPLNSNYTCDEFDITNADCDCNVITKSDLDSDARTARQNEVVFWSVQNASTMVCCGDETSGNAGNMLRVLLNFVFVQNLNLYNCQNLMINNRVTMYGLEKIKIQSSGSTAHPEQSLIMEKTDKTNSTLEYKDFHVIHMHMEVITGDNPLRAWSIIRRTGNITTNRGPLRRRGLNQREDGRYMLTYIYV